MLLLLFIAFILALIVGFDVGYSMILAAWLGVEYRGAAVDTAMMPLSMIAGVDTYALVQVPLFILAGELMNRGGLTLRLIDWAQAIVGRVKGSLGHVSILTNLIMAGGSRSGGRGAGGPRQARGLPPSTGPQWGGRGRWVGVR